MDSGDDLSDEERTEERLDHPDDRPRELTELEAMWELRAEAIKAKQSVQRLARRAKHR